MEKFVPLLIALAIFGFKSYQNYMKEQEAALKRRKVNGPIPSQSKLETPTHTVQKNTNEKVATPFYSEKIKETNEIQRFKKEREEQRLASLNKKSQLAKIQQKEPAIKEDFDLRKAVIMSVILDRPYK